MFDVKDFKKWPNGIQSEFDKDYFKKLSAFLEKERSSQIAVFPKKNDIFRAFRQTPFDKIKVVILGQDPYHKEGQAHGLSFSVPEGVKRPPSLVNIYKELKALESRPQGDLLDWAKQGVFLLNSVLTVREGEAASHRNKGWELFTDSVLKAINESPNPVVYMLWGAYAQKKAAFLNNKNHLVLQAPHPSPLSAYRGFLGCGHFEKANQFLSNNVRQPIKWV